MYLEKNSVTSTLQKCVVNLELWEAHGLPFKKVRCTLHSNIIPPQTDLEEHIPDDNIILAWDVDHRVWRRVELTRIIRFTPEV